ncbi:MAG: hypothetical protein WBQ73_03510 [Candidatus Babeliales bacterium]
MKFYYILPYIILLVTSQIFLPNHVISLFLKKYPYIQNEERSNQCCQKVSDTLCTAGQCSYHTLTGIAQQSHLAGIYAVYGSYITTSDFNGHLSFPLSHDENSLYLLITPRVTPITLTQQVIHHWTLQHDTPHALYKLEKQYDKEADLHFWNVQKVPVPPDMTIPLETIIIFAHPETMYVPLGSTPSAKSEHFILPPLYIKATLRMTPQSLYIMNMRQFFATLGYIHSYQKDAYRKLFIP